MALLTFDNTGPTGPDLENLFGSSYKPDVVECGENNDVWVNARISTKSMELVSKIDGKILKKVVVDADFPRIAASYGIGPRQVLAVTAAVVSSPAPKAGAVNKCGS